MVHSRPPSGSLRSVLAVFLLVASLETTVLGDKLILKDGRTFEGRLTGKDDSIVVFEVRVGKAWTKVTFQPSEVAEIQQAETPTTHPKGETQPAEPAGAADPGYVVIPVKGIIGVEVTAPLLEKCLSAAKSAKPAVVILHIGSGGGSVKELQEMMKALEKFSDVRIVAYVSKAYSAAAVLAMSCKEIIMAPDGTIGGAVVFRIGPAGTLWNIEEKFESILRAEFRAAVTRAGHNPLILEGMMSTAGALSLRKTEKGVEVIRGTQKDANVIKPQGRILTMTADEAVSCGLAIASVAKVGDCNKPLGVEKWRAMPSPAEQIFKEWDRKITRAEADYKSLAKETRQLVEMARTNDPRRFSYLYVSTPSGSGPTPDSKEKWEKHAQICRGCLKRAEANLTHLRKIAADYPALVAIGRIEYSDKELEEYQDQLTAIRKGVESSRLD